MIFEEYHKIKKNIVPIFDWKLQEQNIDTPKSMTLDEAINSGTLKKQAYAYCIYLGYYLTKILGYPDDVIRLRQHSPNERAHYADDAWDLEIKTQQFGWVEICGIHDRTDYDLKRHGEYSKQNFEIPMGSDNNEREIPQILEIAFGPDRIVYTLLETTFYVENGKRILKLPPILAPNSIAVFPLKRNQEDIRNLALKIHGDLLKHRIASFYDEKGSIGKLYSRQDEIGTPFCITVDFISLEDYTVTLRERDTREQERVEISALPKLIKKKLHKF
jgi:glycyl-tRNA synthetase